MTGGSPLDLSARADAGTQIERSRAPAGELDEHRRLDAALRALQPQRRGTVDAYVVSIALDSDPVFGREARAAGEVLERRYGARGRTIVLAGTDGSGPSALPRGTPATLGDRARPDRRADGQAARTCSSSTRPATARRSASITMTATAATG